MYHGIKLNTLLSKSHLTHWDGNWSYRSKIMADAEAAEKCGLFQTVVFE